MELKGLRIAFLGDSITEGVGASSVDKVYWNVLKENEGIIPFGYGIGGTRIARKRVPTADKPRHDLDFNMRADDMESDVDVVCVFGGTNDYGHGDAPMGNIYDNDVYTFYGALNSLYTKLIKKYPKAYIFVMTPLHRKEEERQAGDEHRRLCDYVDAIRKTCDKYSIPVLDLYANSGINPQDEVIRDLFMPDGLHPNDAGYKRLAGMVAQFLKNQYYEK